MFTVKLAEHSEAILEVTCTNPNWSIERDLFTEEIKFKHISGEAYATCFSVMGDIGTVKTVLIILSQDWINPLMVHNVCYSLTDIEEDFSNSLNRRLGVFK